MPQTDGQITAKHSTLEVAADCLNYLDISGSSNSFDPGGSGAHMTGSTHTFAEHLPLIGLGKKEPVTATIRIVYTEEDNEAADIIDGFFTNQTLHCLRWRPAGAGAGNWQFIGRGYFITPITPAGDATSGDIITVEVTWFGAELPMSPQAT